MSRDLSYPSKVANATGATDICNLWYNHYKTLFSSVGYDSHTVKGILDNVSRPNIHDIKYVTCTEVRDILATMSNNKAGDSYGLCTEHYQLAGDLYCSLFAVCFNVMFVHGSRCNVRV